MKNAATRTHALTLLHIEFPLLGDLAVEQEHMYDNWFASYKADLEEQFGENGDALDEGFVDSIAAERQLREEYYPQYIRRSTFLISYGAVERGLHRLAKAASDDGLATAQPSERNFYLNDAKTFFCTHAGVDYSVIADDWGELDTCRLIRNTFAHNGGRLDPAGRDYATIEEFIRKRTDIEIDQFQSVILEESWCSAFVGLSRRLLVALVGEVER